jgi:hypothetical protein
MAGEINAAWRFWTAEDGLAESYTRKIAIGVDGRVRLRHGAVSSMSVLDGYRISLVPEPRTSTSIDRGRLARVYSDVRGNAWTVENGRLVAFSNGSWHVHTAERTGEYMIAVNARS